MAEQPLLTKTLACPVCAQQVPFRIANPRLYSVVGRDSDRRVTGYRWLHDLITEVQPHHYKVWQCPNCLFADFAERIDQDRQGGNDDQIRRSYRDISIEKRMVLDSLRELVPAGDLDRSGAIAIHLAALLITALPSQAGQVNHGKLGQLALRLAWLYREAGQIGAGPAEPGASQAMAALGEAGERFEQMLAEAAELLLEIRRQGRRRAQELGLPDRADDNPYLAQGDLIEVRLAALKTEVTALQMAVLQDRQGRMTVVPAPAPAGAEPLDRALLDLVPLWPELPRNETQSLRLALEAFEYSYQFEGEGDGVDQGVAQVNLILDILTRLGELDRALEWTSQISKYANDTAADLRNRLSKAKAGNTLSGFDETVINRKIAALGLTQQKAGESRREILLMMLERDRARIDPVLAATAQQTPVERSKALAGLGLHDGVVALLAGEISRTGKEGQGWFKGLFQG